MAKGNRRPIGQMAQGAVAEQTKDTIARKDEEIEFLKQQLEGLQQSTSDGRIQEIPADKVFPLKIEGNKAEALTLIRQPRTYFDPKGLEDLANSINTDKLREPIVARMMPDGNYEILDGERRWRCHIMLGKNTIKALVKENVSDDEALEYALTTDSLKEKVSSIEQTVSVINLLRLRLDMTEEGVRSTLYALNNLALENSNSQVAEDHANVIYGVLNSLGLKLGSMVARLPLLDIPSYLRKAVADNVLSPTNALLINRAPQELHHRLLQEGATLSKRDLQKLIVSLKTELKSTIQLEAGQKIENGFFEDNKPLPELVADRWRSIKRSRFLKQGGDSRLNRKLKKVHELLQDVEEYIKQKEESSAR